MARDYTKTTIRLEKIHERSLKKTYKGLTPLEKRVIKNREAFEQVSKELDFFWRKTAVYNRVNGRYVADQEKTDWTDFERHDKQMTKLSKQRDRFETQHGLTPEQLDKIEEKFYLLNRGRFYGGSF